MRFLQVEMMCPKNGFERFRVKVITRFNMPQNAIVPKFRSRPIPGDLSCLLVGKNVSEQEITQYLAEYFRQKGVWERIINMKLIK